MIKKKEYPFEKIQNLIEKQNKLLEELKKFSFEMYRNKYGESEKTMISQRMDKIKDTIKLQNNQLIEEIKGINLAKELGLPEEVIKTTPKNFLNSKPKESAYEDREDESLKFKGGKIYNTKELSVKGLEKETIVRLREAKKKVEKIKHEKIKTKSKYSELSSKLFSKVSKKLLGNESFKKLQENLIKANLDYSPTGYISFILFTTLISVFVSIFVMLFFLFFNIEAISPFITRTSEEVLIRLGKVIWIVIVAPVGTFFTLYFYPSLEKKSAEYKIDTELPFATIHMAAIAGSMINPVKIFEILITTKEYKALEKEFTKLLNEINIYGSDLVNALKNTAKNTSSKRLSELLNGLSTNISSGGDLPSFFEKRSETLLFEYRIQREKATRGAESFMNIYISMAIASPMILMLLLMMLKLSGLGLSTPASTLTLIMVLGVVVLNAVLITFLHLKKQK
ncbi:MAG: type II secretion system F family protein [Candidatus Pacearchaeota archaeon]|jgi:hypothetical protein